MEKIKNFVLMVPAKLQRFYWTWKSGIHLLIRVFAINFILAAVIVLFFGKISFAIFYAIVGITLGASAEILEKF